MKVNHELSAQQQRHSGATVENVSEVEDTLHTPRKLSFRENAVLTLKVFAGAGLVLVALWGLNLWISPN